MTDQKSVETKAESVATICAKLSSVNIDSDTHA